MLSRRAVVLGLATSFAAVAAGCARPGATPATPAASTTPPPPTPTQPLAATPTTAAAASPTAAASPAVAASPSPPLVALPTPTAVDQVTLDIRLWNGAADVQLDGRALDPGEVVVNRGRHQAAALVDGQVVAVADAPRDGGRLDLVVPPPLASLAVMIENQADARPQTGLTHADVVYEALAEGGITRFIALYLSGDAATVGPVRSLRHYFAFFAADYAADVVHIGASPEGYAWRDAMHMGHLDETYGEPGIWRVGTRPPPHNAYTNTAADRGFLAQRGAQRTRSWGPLLFAEQAPVGELSASTINLRFRPWAYRVDYTWDPATARYLRNMEGSPHRDAQSGEQIAPATVVVQFADVEAIPNDPKYRLDVNLVGASGQLIVFSNGTRRDGTWTKPGPSNPSVWQDPSGNPLVIPPGPVWVEVVPLESPLTIS
jgi:hypothetical protein